MTQSEVRGGTLVPVLLRGLCDDAAMFPPGEAPPVEAVPAHRVHRAAWYAPLVGPFLVGAAQLAPLAEEVPWTRPGSVPAQGAVLVVPRGPRGLRAALGTAAEVLPGAGFELVGVELACGPDGTPAEAAREAAEALDALLPPGVGGVVEVRRTAPGPNSGEGTGEGTPDVGRTGSELDGALDVLAATPYRAKLRTGGLTAAAFPGTGELAGFVSGCVDRGLPFKCTAGLHHAVRHTDPATGFAHHGFTNILAATHAALGGATRARLADILECRSGTELAADLRTLTGDQAAAVRAAFTGYGTCSIAEPLAELAELGLITLPSAHLESV
ncbi:hypothetical protein [Streptacidiphilus sp. EB129]|uniref:hypothetical protein n=1 Tax=Streptacidiphilus sp. EB129 TaxID=3156262 RepID=UPI0035146FE8